jgi:N-acetylneuraminic acid mutarotase
MNDLPEGLSQSATAFSGSTMYFAGGYVANGTKQTFSTTKVWKYDSTTDTYTRLTDLPEARGVGGLALHHNKLYYLGGSDSKRVDSSKCWSLDLSNTAAGWQSIASLPNKTNRAGVAVLNDRIFLIGGQQLYDANAIYQSAVYSYDPATNTWQQLASLPSARSHIMASTFVRKGKIIVAGGEGAGREKLSGVSEYDPSTNSWKSLTSLPAARFSGVGDVFGDKLCFSTGMGNTFEKTTWMGDFVRTG